MNVRFFGIWLKKGCDLSSSQLMRLIGSFSRIFERRSLNSELQSGTCGVGPSTIIAIRSFSELVSDLRRYHSTGEVNFRVADSDAQQAMMAELKRRYAGGTQDELDGITVAFGDLGDEEWWWFNVRPSNTEPLLRLNLEASRRDLRDEKRDELIEILGEQE